GRDAPSERARLVAPPLSSTVQRSLRGCEEISKRVATVREIRTPQHVANPIFEFLHTLSPRPRRVRRLARACQIEPAPGNWPGGALHRGAGSERGQRACPRPRNARPHLSRRVQFAGPAERLARLAWPRREPERCANGVVQLG